MRSESRRTEPTKQPLPVWRPLGPGCLGPLAAPGPSTAGLRHSWGAHPQQTRRPDHAAPRLAGAGLGRRRGVVRRGWIAERAAVRACQIRTGARAADAVERTEVRGWGGGGGGTCCTPLPLCPQLSQAPLTQHSKDVPRTWRTTSSASSPARRATLRANSSASSCVASARMAAAARNASVATAMEDSWAASGSGV
jgi:hypothetical protein